MTSRQSLSISGFEPILSKDFELYWFNKAILDQSHILAHSRYLVDVSFLLSYVFGKLS